MSQRQGLGERARLSRPQRLPQHLALVWVLPNVGLSRCPPWMARNPHGVDAQAGHSEARHEGEAGEQAAWNESAAQHLQSAAASQAPGRGGRLEHSVEAAADPPASVGQPKREA